MKQYTNAYRRIPVYAYQFMAGPAALGPPAPGRAGVYSRAGTGRPGGVGELRCGGGRLKEMSFNVETLLLYCTHTDGQIQHGIINSQPVDEMEITPITIRHHSRPRPTSKARSRRNGIALRRPFPRALCLRTWRAGASLAPAALPSAPQHDL